MIFKISIESSESTICRANNIILIRKQATVNLPVLAIVVKIFMGGKQGQA
jgi:hypothetical protein